MTAASNLIGARIGRLTVVRRSENASNGRTRWQCRCDCGREIVAGVSNLKSGHTRSCGCLNSEVASAKARRTNLSHGHNQVGKQTPTHRSWDAMLKRCRNENHVSYSSYGGRGITVCERWLSFKNFLADMGERPEGTSIDRVNNDGNYEPGNCRWATRSEQQRNKRKRGGTR